MQWLQLLVYWLLAGCCPHFISCFLGIYTLDIPENKDEFPRKPKSRHQWWPLPRSSKAPRLWPTEVGFAGRCGGNPSGLCFPVTTVTCVALVSREKRRKQSLRKDGRILRATRLQPCVSRSQAQNEGKCKGKPGNMKSIMLLLSSCLFTRVGGSTNYIHRVSIPAKHVALECGHPFNIFPIATLSKGGGCGKLQNPSRRKTAGPRNRERIWNSPETHPNPLATDW